MNKLALGILGAILVFGGLIALNKSGSTSNASSPSATFSTIQQDISANAKLYDVRTTDEYKAGHIDGSIHYALQDMQAGKLPDLAKDTKLYVYCQSGNRSSQATTLLKNAGFTNIIDLHGISNVLSMGGNIITD